MPGRSYTGNGYRYGFNGMEKDDEVKGNGNSIDFGARINDPRLGRWLSLDPEMAKFPAESPYLVCGANPIIYLDPDGRKKTITHVYIDQNTGRKTSISVEVSGELMSKARQGAARVLGIDVQGTTQTIYDWYDINQTVTHVFKDGKEISTSESTTAGDYRTTTTLNWEWLADFKVNDKIEETNWGGVNWTSEVGQGQETRKGFGNIKSENIDFLLGRLQGLASGGPGVLGKIDELIEANKVSKAVLNEALGIMAEALDRGVDGAGIVQDMVDGVKELGAERSTAKQCTYGCDSMDFRGKRYSANDTGGLGIKKVEKEDGAKFHSIE